MNRGLDSHMTDTVKDFVGSLCYEDMCFELCLRQYLSVMPPHINGGITKSNLIKFLGQHLQIAFTFLYTGELFHENQRLRDKGEIVIVAEKHNVFLLKNSYRLSRYHISYNRLHGLQKWGLENLEYLKRMEILMDHFQHNGSMKSMFVPDKGNLTRTQYELMMILLKGYSCEYLDKPIYWKVDKRWKNRATRIDTEVVVPKLGIGLKKIVKVPDMLKQEYNVGRRLQLPPLDIDGSTKLFETSSGMVKIKPSLAPKPTDILKLRVYPGPKTELETAKAELKSVCDKMVDLMAPDDMSENVFKKAMLPLQLLSVELTKKVRGLERKEEERLKALEPSTAHMNIFQRWDWEAKEKLRKIEEAKALREEKMQEMANRRANEEIEAAKELEILKREALAKIAYDKRVAEGKDHINIQDESEWSSESDDNSETESLTAEEKKFVKLKPTKLSARDKIKHKKLTQRMKKNLLAKKKKNEKEIFKFVKQKSEIETKPGLPGLPKLEGTKIETIDPLPDQNGPRREEHFIRICTEEKIMKLENVRIPLLDLLKGVDGSSVWRRSRIYSARKEQKLFQDTSRDKKFRKRYKRFRQTVFEGAKGSRHNVKKYLSDGSRGEEDPLSQLEDKYTVRSVLYMSALLGGPQRAPMLSWNDFWHVFKSQLESKKNFTKKFNAQMKRRDLAYFRTMIPVLFELI